MILVLLGPPGSGKGTQAEKIMQKYGISKISTGDLLRNETKKKSELGRKVKKIIDSGKLVPDDIMVEIINDRIAEKDCKNGFILDGFPRTTAQADALTSLLKRLNLKINKVISFTVDDDAILKRLSGRWTCKKCQAVFHEVLNPPKSKGICDKCGAALYQRDDQKENAVKKRLAEYREKTEPLINYYKHKGILADVDAMPQISEVFSSIVKILDAL